MYLTRENYFTWESIENIGEQTKTIIIIYT